MFGIGYMFPEYFRYQKIVDRHEETPESRLPPSIVGSIAIPISILWFAWSNSPSVHWLVSIAAQVPFGFGFVLVYISVQEYLVDAYTIYAASVLAANTIFRSAFGAIFPLFTNVSFRSSSILVHGWLSASIVHVSKFRWPLGVFGSCLPGSGMRPISYLVLSLRESHPCQMSICSRSSSALGRDGGGSIESWSLLLLNDPEQETNCAISEIMRIDMRHGCQDVRPFGVTCPPGVLIIPVFGTNI